MLRDQPSARRRPRRALQEIEYKGLLRWAYLQLYAEDPGFRDALSALYTAHCAHWAGLLAQVQHFWQTDHLNWSFPVTSEQARQADAYRAAVASLAQRYGLDRLPDGEQVIHNWCRLTADLALSDGRAPAPQWFGQGEGWGGVYPDIGEVVSREEWRGPAVDGVQWRIVDERRAPLVHIAIQDEWDPRREPMAEAHERILATLTAQLDAELERLAADTEARGYVFYDTAPKAGQHLRWLFEHVALGKTYPELAARDLGWDGAHQTLANAVSKYARVLGVTLSRRPRGHSATV